MRANTRHHLHWREAAFEKNGEKVVERNCKWGNRPSIGVKLHVKGK
jgi:hypothetical protein